jgi:hypothetical protein
MPTLDRIGFGWSMRRLASICGLDNHESHPDRPNWPDTEILGNMLLRENEIPVKIIGHESNFERNKDTNVDHARSISLGMLYSPEYAISSFEWLKDAMSEASERIKKWKKSDLEESERISQ